MQRTIGPAFLSLAYSSASSVVGRDELLMVRAHNRDLPKRMKGRPVSSIVVHQVRNLWSDSEIRRRRGLPACLQGIQSIIQEMAGQWLSLRFNMISFIMVEQFRAECLLCKTRRRRRSLPALSIGWVVVLRWDCVHIIKRNANASLA